MNGMFLVTVRVDSGFVGEPDRVTVSGTFSPITVAGMVVFSESGKLMIRFPTLLVDCS